MIYAAQIGMFTQWQKVYIVEQFAPSPYWKIEEYHVLAIYDNPLGENTYILTDKPSSYVVRHKKESEIFEDRLDAEKEMQRKISEEKKRKVY